MLVREEGAPTYFAGPENHLVVEAIGRLIAAKDRSPGAMSPGPVTLIGPPGCGKSLLASGVEAAWTDSAGADAVLALTGVDLRRRLERALISERKAPGSVACMADRIANVRLLIVENLEGLAESEEAVHLLTASIDRLIATGARVLVTAGKPLGEVAGFSARLVGRLAAGLTLEVAAPAEATRKELLTASLHAYGGQIEGQAASDLAAWVTADARRVLSIAEQLYQRFGTKTVIGRREAKAFVSESIRDDASTSLADIVSTVGRYYRMPLRTLRSSSRKAPVVLARAVAIYLARHLTPLSYEEIGRYLGGRDHTTVMHNYNRIERRAPGDRALRSAIDDLLRKLGRADLIAGMAANRGATE